MVGLSSQFTQKELIYSSSLTSSCPFLIFFSSYFLEAFTLDEDITNVQFLLGFWY